MFTILYGEDRLFLKCANSSEVEFFACFEFPNVHFRQHTNVIVMNEVSRFIKFNVRGKKTNIIPFLIQLGLLVLCIEYIAQKLV